MFVGCSISIFLVDDPSLDPLECVRRADLALYQAKSDGRGRGAISPSQFVPITAESSLIDALGNFVMRRAFLDSRKRKGLRVGVNVSASQIRMHDFVDKVQAIAKETDIDPSRVELEITEGLLLGRTQKSGNPWNDCGHLDSGLCWMTLVPAIQALAICATTRLTRSRLTACLY